MNSKHIKAVIAGCALSAAPAAMGQNALVLNGAAFDDIGEFGATAAGLTPTVVESVEDFQAKIAAGPWQVVVLDVPSLDGGLDVIADDLNAYLKEGGKIVMNYWNLDSNPLLQSLMDVASATDFTAARSYFSTEVVHPSWGSIVGIGAGSDRWGDNGDVLTANSGGAIYGVFDSSASDDGAMIVGNGGRTIVNGHDWDSLSDDGAARHTLLRNQIRYVSDMGAAPWRLFQWNSPSDVVGPITLKVTQDRPVLKVTDVGLDGDRFEVLINGAPLFTTSDPTTLGLGIADRYDEAYASGVSDLAAVGSGHWSAGAARLAPGTYELSFRIIETAPGFASGSGRFQLAEAPVPQVSGGPCVLDFFGDPDGFGTLRGPVDHDYALWRDQFGGEFFTDYRADDDKTLWPQTDLWAGPSEISWTHSYIVPADLETATLRLSIAGFADIREFELRVDGAVLETFSFPGAFQQTHVLEVPVPLSRIDGSTRFTLASGGSDGFILDYVELQLCSAECYADCDDSGSLDFFDFLCFQTAFAAGAAQADCDASGSHDFFDFLCFQSEFAAGCP